MSKHIIPGQPILVHTNPLAIEGIWLYRDLLCRVFSVTKFETPNMVPEHANQSTCKYKRGVPQPPGQRSLRWKNKILWNQGHKSFMYMHAYPACLYE